MPQIVKQDKCSSYSGSITLLFQQFTVSSKIVLLIYTCSTFPYQHTAVVSCFGLRSPLLTCSM